VAEPVLLDTCSALWLVGGELMSDLSVAAMRAAFEGNVGVYVSPFTAWEIGTLVAKGRMQFGVSPEVWFETLLNLPGARLAELTPRILFASTTLPGTPPSDPADRIIAATARICGYVVITRDRELLKYARQGHLRVVAC
jgi:PIN domain nuclease of toxin-antitoxin system